MIAPLRVLSRALVHLYDESLLLMRGNVVWFAGSIPLFILVMAASWLFVPPSDPEAGPLVWPLLSAACVVLVMPSPFAVGMYALSAEIVTGDTPELRVFWVAVRRWWGHGLAMFAIGVVVLGALLFYTAFYLSVVEGWLQAVSVLWIYAIVFWLNLQPYLLPLLVTSDDAGAANDGGVSRDPSLRSLYKRAAILALANPFFSLVLLGSAVLTTMLSAIAIPVYPLLAMAYVALVGARALRHLREKYLPPEERATEEAIE